MFSNQQASRRVSRPESREGGRVDADSLGKLKELSAESGIPYQRLLNSILRDRLANASTVQSRLDQIEKELARLKKHFAA